MRFLQERRFVALLALTAGSICHSALGQSPPKTDYFSAGENSPNMVTQPGYVLRLPYGQYPPRLSGGVWIQRGPNYDRTSPRTWVWQPDRPAAGWGVAAPTPPNRSGVPLQGHVEQNDFSPDGGGEFGLPPNVWTPFRLPGHDNLYVHNGRFYMLVPPPDGQSGPPQMFPARVAMPPGYTANAPTEGALPSGDELLLVQPLAGFVRKALAEGVFARLVESARPPAPSIYEGLAPTAAEINAAKEAVGVAWATEQMEARGWTLAGNLTYRGNQGVDLIFRRTVNGVEEYAAVEAKYGRGLGLLRSYNGNAGQVRQGTMEYTLTRIQRYLRFGDQDNEEGMALAGAVRQAAQQGRLSNFASFSKGESLFLIPKGFGRVPGVQAIQQ